MTYLSRWENDVRNNFWTWFWDGVHIFAYRMEFITASADPQIQALGSDRCWELICHMLHILYFDTVVKCGASVSTRVLFHPQCSIQRQLHFVWSMTIKRKWMDKVIRYCSNRYQILFWWLQEILEINNFSHLTGASWSFLMPIVTQWCPCLVTMDTNGHRCNKFFFFFTIWWVPFDPIFLTCTPQITKIYFFKNLNIDEALLLSISRLGPDLLFYDSWEIFHICVFAGTWGDP